jgi:predicted 3-demethylubiquinone-9 3-methyltransferase (glyoxalase superfamily)
VKQIIPNLWMDGQAEEAARFYAEVFENANVGRIDRYTEAGKEIHGQEPGSVLTVEFEIEGQTFIALNGGPQFKINPSISFFVRCESADEVNRLWEKFSDGATALMPLGSYPFSERYGWLQDKFGVSWQLGVFPGANTQKIVTSLLFVNEQCGKAEEAMQFYTSVFPES